MKTVFSELQGASIKNGEQVTEQLKSILTQQLPELEHAFIQDLSHISQAAIYSGNMTIDAVIHIKDHLYRCDYSYAWQIAWTCSGTQESGRVKEKIRFTLGDNGEIAFRFLKLEAE